MPYTLGWKWEEKGRETRRETNGGKQKHYNPFSLLRRALKPSSSPLTNPVLESHRDLHHGLEYQWLMKILPEPIFGFFTKEKAIPELSGITALQCVEKQKAKWPQKQSPTKEGAGGASSTELGGAPRLRFWETVPCCGHLPPLRHLSQRCRYRRPVS